jgi:hypothetical protein
MRRMSPEQRRISEWKARAKEDIAKKHPDYQVVLFSLYANGAELICDVKDKDGDWYRYMHNLED